MVLSDQAKGLVLAISSSIFIGSSFIVKKRSGGFSYLKEPIWWAGMLSMVVGEIANFAAYAFAPAILVTPLGALSIIVSAALAHALLNEKLNIFGMLGCGLCINGSLVIALHAPPERPLSSVVEIWDLALQPGFLAYTFLAFAAVVMLIVYVAPQQGSSNIFVYISICSIAGSLSVISCKALGIALKLTIEGNNQMLLLPTYVFAAVVLCCVVTQMNYLNKALDLFNAAIVSPVYYVMFTVLTILASIVMFRDVQSWRQIFTEGAGFVTIVAGTFLLHTTKDMDVTVADLTRLTKDSQSFVNVTSSKNKWEMEMLYTTDLEVEGRGRLTTGSNRR